MALPQQMPPHGAASARPGGAQALSAFEVMLLAHLCEGASNLQIALRIGRSEKTVRNRLSVLYQKLGVPNRAAAVAIWLMQSQAVIRKTSEIPL
jgi:DNA-binding NarL/FixJ family response regulator